MGTGSFAEILHAPSQFTYFDLIDPAYDPVLACTISFFPPQGNEGRRLVARVLPAFGRELYRAYPRQQSTYWLFLLELATAKVSPFPSPCLWSAMSVLLPSNRRNPFYPLPAGSKRATRKAWVLRKFPRSFEFSPYCFYSD